MFMFVGVGAIRQIASEVVQYVMGKASQLQGKRVGEIEDQGTQTEPDLLTAAMNHQQHRAEVSNGGTVVLSLWGVVSQWKNTSVSVGNLCLEPNCYCR